MTARRITLTDRLRERREDLVQNDPTRYTQAGIGARMHPALKQATVSLYEREPERLIPHGPTYAITFFNQYGFADEEAIAMARELFAEHTRVLGIGRGETAMVVDFGQLVYSYWAGTGPAWGDDEVVEKLIIPGLIDDGRQYVGLKATGDSMAPYLRKGDTAIVLRDEGSVRPGDCVGIWLADDGCVIKRFVQELGGLIILESLNPAPGEDRYFQAPLGSRILGRVVKRLLND